MIPHTTDVENVIRRTSVQREVERDGGLGRHRRCGAGGQRKRLPDGVHALVFAAHRADHVSEPHARVVWLRGRQHGGQTIFIQPRLQPCKQCGTWAKPRD